MTLMLTFVTDVKCCARCQQDHPKLEFKEIENYKFATHFAICPTNSQPLLMNVKDNCYQSKKKGAPVIVGPEFDKFWDLYPKKESKKDCRVKWSRLDTVTHDSIFKALAWQTKTDKWLDGFAPHPLTYLNQEKWNDLPYMPATRGPQHRQEFNAPKGLTMADLKAGKK